MSTDKPNSEHEVITVTVHSCARCGADHEQVMFKRFLQPIKDGDGTVWNYWAMCPFENDPILLRVVGPENK